MSILTDHVMSGFSLATEWSLTEPSSDPAKKKETPKGQKAREWHAVVDSSSGKNALKLEKSELLTISNKIFKDVLRW